MATVERNNSSRTRIREGGRPSATSGWGGKKKSTEITSNKQDNTQTRGERRHRNDMQLWHLSTFGVEGRGSKEK